MLFQSLNGSLFGIQVAHCGTYLRQGLLYFGGNSNRKRGSVALTTPPRRFQFSCMGCYEFACGAKLPWQPPGPKLPLKLPMWEIIHL